jgi:hypothetical protein
MNPPRVPIAQSDLLQGAHERRSFAIGRRELEPHSGQRLDDAEDVGRAAADVLVISARQPAGPHRDAGLRVFVQNDRSLVEANDRLQRIQLTGVEPEHVLHAIHELVADRRHAPHFFPATA